MKYVALLRGVNVGGNNKVSMKDLKASFEDAGMEHVVTYINSGNVIFESNEESKQKLTNILQEVIKDTFGFSVKVLIHDKPTILTISKSLPAAWTNDKVMKCDVMFLWESVASPDVLRQIIIKPEIDNVLYESGAILWCVERKQVTKSGLLKLVGTDLYKHMTIRNCNTVRKLALLMEA